MSESKRVKIVSDGTARGTHIYDEKGEEMRNVASLRIDVHPGVIVARIELFVMRPELEIDGALLASNALRSESKALASINAIRSDPELTSAAKLAAIEDLLGTLRLEGRS